MRGRNFMPLHTYTHHLNASPRIFTSKLPSTFMCHIFFEAYQMHSNHTVLYKVHLFRHAYFSLCSSLVCTVGRAPITCLPSTRFLVACFHLTPPRNAILCFLYVCNLKRLTKMDILRIKESNNDNSNNNKMRVSAQSNL